MSQAEIALEGMREGFVTLDRDLRITSLNPSAARMHGSEPEAILGRTLSEAWPAAAGGPVEELCRKAVLDREPGIAEHHNPQGRDGRPSWIEVRVQPLEGGGVAAFLRDITLRRQADRAKLEAEHQFQALAQVAAQVVWTTDALGAVLEESQSWLDFTGQAPGEALGWGWADALAEEDKPEVLAEWRRCVSDRRPFEMEYRLCHRDGVPRWTTGRALPLFDAAGGLRSWVGMNTDISAQRLADERHFLLAREVDHRAKNALAVVQSLVRLTRADDTADFIDAVQGRVAALGRAHTLLSHEHWQGVQLGRILAEESEAHAGVLGDGAPRIRLEGPAVRLAPDAVQPFALAVHELMDNAARHGSLASESGSLCVTWRREAGGPLQLEWIERDGSGKSTEPPTPGFGGALIQATLVDQLQGKLDLRWEPEGFSASLLLQPNQLAEGPETEAQEPRPAPGGGFAGTRVLVVEDEALVALDMARTLGEAGCRVLGPISGLDQAFRFLDALDAPPDLAVLDLNLAGRSSVPLADLLLEQGVPVVFATGYGELPASASRLAHVRLLSKPFAAAELVSALREADAARNAPPPG